MSRFFIQPTGQEYAKKPPHRCRATPYTSLQHNCHRSRRALSPSAFDTLRARRIVSNWTAPFDLVTKLEHRRWEDRENSPDSEYRPVSILCRFLFPGVRRT